MDILDFSIFSTDSYIKVIKKRIKTKEEKSKDYVKLKELDLALVFCDPIGEDLESVIQKNISILFNGNKVFSKFFIVSNRFCIRYNAIDNAIDKMILSKDDDLRIKILGRLTAERKKSLEDPEWID